MAFALTLVHLEEALQKPGCPICRLGDEAARRSVDGFLWENVNDPESRRPLQEAYGFCLNTPACWSPPRWRVVAYCSALT